MDECDLAYNNQLMVLVWSSLASRDARLLGVSLDRLPATPPTTSFVTYVRCHDDIGWAVDDRDAAAVGWDGWSHRRFLVDFYAGRHPGSFAEGGTFQDDPVTGDARTVGMTATLAGLSAAERTGDPAAVDAAVRRILLVHAVGWGWGGLPLLYMGDEVGLGDDLAYLDDPARAEDSRWRNRPPMDWARVAQAEADPSSPAGRVLAGLRALAAVRRATPSLHAAATSRPVDLGTPPVLAWHRHHRRHGSFVGVANFGDAAAMVDIDRLCPAGLGWRLAHASDPGIALASDQSLPPLATAWFRTA